MALLAVAGAAISGATKVIGNKQEANMQKRQAAMQKEQNQANLTLAALQAKNQPKPESNKALYLVGAGLAVLLVVILLIVILKRRNA